MSDTSKPEVVEVINQPVKPDEAVADVTPEVEPAVTEVIEEVAKTDDEILDDLTPDVQKEQPKLSRKFKAIERSIADFDEALLGDDKVDIALLAQKTLKNDKGLSSFAEAHNYDPVELQRLVDAELGNAKSEADLKIEELQAKVDSVDNEKRATQYKDTVKNLIVGANMTVGDFKEKHGETFSLLVDGFVARGSDAVEAAGLAFKQIQPTIDPTAEKTALLNNTKTGPRGNDVVVVNEIPMDKASNVHDRSKYSDEQRRAYNAKYRDPNTKVVKYK